MVQHQVANHQGQVPGLGQGHHRLRIGCVERQRFLHEHVLARVQGQARVLGVVLGRRGQHDRVHVVGRQGFAQVLAQARVRREGSGAFAARIRVVTHQA